MKLYIKKTFLFLSLTLIFTACNNESSQSTFGLSPTAGFAGGSNEVLVMLQMKNRENNISKLVVEFSRDENFEDTLLHYEENVDYTSAGDNVEDFLSFISLEKSKYYLRAFLDDNENGIIDNNEPYGYYSRTGEEINRVRVSNANRQIIILELES